MVRVSVLLCSWQSLSIRSLTGSYVCVSTVANRGSRSTTSSLGTQVQLESCVRDLQDPATTAVGGTSGATMLGSGVVHLSIPKSSALHMVPPTPLKQCRKVQQNLTRL